MNKTFWKSPVDVRLHHAKRIRTITTSPLAFEFLTTMWPDASHGPSFYKAILACYDAEDGKVSHDLARSALLSASHDAQITA